MKDICLVGSVFRKKLLLSVIFFSVMYLEISLWFCHIYLVTFVLHNTRHVEFCLTQFNGKRSLSRSACRSDLACHFVERIGGGFSAPRYVTIHFTHSVSDTRLHYFVYVDILRDFQNPVTDTSECRIFYVLHQATRESCAFCRWWVTKNSWKKGQVNRRDCLIEPLIIQKKLISMPIRSYR